jgi:prenylcysteine oxidase/farnesylcysteine lyase
MLPDPPLIVSSLTSQVSLAAEGAMAIQGGNWQIFHEMVQRSGAQVVLDTAVVGIDKASEGPSGRAQYTVQTTSGSTPGNPTTHPTTFDNIIMANPYQFSGISVGDGVLDNPIEPITYVQLHVTIFTSPSPFSPLFFDLPESETVPGMVLTTLAHGDTPTSGADGAGKAGFFSLSILGKATNPQTQQKEFVYKIFSPEVITPEFLRYVVNPLCFFCLLLSSGNVADSYLCSRLFGTTVPSDFTGEDSPITWYTPHVFNSYPKTTPRVTFQDPIVGSGVYYTSGMESFISTMETNALMGKNVARLIIDEMQGISIVKTRDGLAWEDKQSILG